MTEFDRCLEVEKRLPPSMIRKTHLTEGAIPTLNTQDTMFGKPLHFVYLGYNLRAVENFVGGLKGDTSNVILISPISRWGLFSVKLRHVEGITLSNQFETRESKVELVMSLTGLPSRKATKALDILQYNFALVESNVDLLRWCSQTGEDVETALASVERLSYTDVLFYLCGRRNSTQEKFVRTLAKYRNGKSHILKYLKSTLDSFIEYKLEGQEPSKEHQYVVEQLVRFYYLEDAMRLRLSLDKVKNLSDLLKGEVML